MGEKKGEEEGKRKRKKTNSNKPKLTGGELHSFIRFCWVIFLLSDPLLTYRLN